MNVLARIGAWLRSTWAALALVVVAIWWALAERRGRQRAEARADLEEDLSEIETDRAKAETEARRSATDARADVETERAAHEVKARVDIAAAEEAIERVREEHRETGAVTAESQRVFEEMRKSGRFP
jgi:flagellar biosynthesis/type III secretory pathway M-ring protein FliF/YscJ